MDSNGYAPMNGARPGYKTNGRVTTSIGKDQPEQQVGIYLTSSSGVLPVHVVIRHPPLRSQSGSISVSDFIFVVHPFKLFLSLPFNFTRCCSSCFLQRCLDNNSCPFLMGFPRHLCEFAIRKTSEFNFFSSALPTTVF